MRLPAAIQMPAVAVALAASLVATPTSGQTPTTTVDHYSKAAANTSPTSLEKKRHLAFHEGALGYDPLKARHLEPILHKLKLPGSVNGTLKKDGFAVAPGAKTFMTAYEQVYHADLPVYVSADSIMSAVHRSVDYILADLETKSASHELQLLITEMRRQLKKGALKRFDKSVRHDVDVYLTVADSLLQGFKVSPQYPDDDAKVEALVSAATAAKGAASASLFGKARVVDYTQFKPRGHYTWSLVLKRYFRSMMWLGRVDFRMIDVKPSGERVFDRRQFDDAMGVAQVLRQSGGIIQWQKVDNIAKLFVGASDNFGPPELPSFLKAVHVTAPAQTLGLEDDVIDKALESGKFGHQRIGGNVRLVNPSAGEVSLAASFRLMGQRYIPDSEVFHQTTAEQVPGRWLPNPLDTAYAVFGNDQAISLLSSDLKRYDHLAHRLERTRLMMDDQPQSYWHANIYTAWLDALRALSPTEKRLADKRLPTVARTEPWGRRVLNAQLASWAELRHDTILYAKQSFTATMMCSFPEAYVDPYPEFWDRIGTLARMLGSIDASSINQQRIDHIVATLKKVSHNFGDMARRELAKKPPTAAELKFINRMVRVQRPEGCGFTQVQTPGWYLDLHYNPNAAADYEPVIADVHTDAQHGRILHVGTGGPNFMVVTVDGCHGATAYVGPVSSYYEVVTDHGKRLGDQQWMQMVGAQEPVSWFRPLVTK